MLNTQSLRQSVARLLVGASLACAIPAQGQIGGGFDLRWNAIACGGLTGGSSGGVYNVAGTFGQGEAGRVSSGSVYVLQIGFWAVAAPDTCYANCDGSSVAPILNANDFQCFLNKYASNDPYANCDHSTTPPVLNANDFQCFLNAYAAGCS